MRAISTINDISNACKIFKIRLAKDTFSHLEILFCQRIALIVFIPKLYHTKFTVKPCKCERPICFRDRSQSILTLPLELATKSPCNSYKNETYQPTILARRYSKVAWVSPLVKISPNCSLVSIFFNLIPCLWISSQNQMVLVA